MSAWKSALGWASPWGRTQCGPPYGDDVDAIVQAGTNLSMTRLAGEAERQLNKPVIAINTAIYWYALRSNGIDDVVDGFGTLLTDFRELPAPE